MKNQTVSYLNTKTWYRFLKVFFILLFVILTIGYNAIIFWEIGLKNIDESKTVITCSIGDKKQFNASSLGISLSSADFNEYNLFDYKKFYEGFNDTKIKKIWDKCTGRDTKDIFVIQRIYELGLQDNHEVTGTVAQELNSMLQSSYSFEKTKNLDYSFKLFDINPSYSIVKFLRYFFLGNLTILVAFELLRRIFYYIALGKLYPMKNENGQQVKVSTKEQQYDK